MPQVADPQHEVSNQAIKSNLLSQTATEGHNNQRKTFNNNTNSHHKEFQCRIIFNNIRYVFLQY